MKPTIYCVGLIYNPEGTKAGLFTTQGQLWPCVVRLRGVDTIAQRIKETTEKLFEQEIEWQNVKPLDSDWSILPCKARIQVFRTREPGLIYACSTIRPLDKITNSEIIELLKENSFI